MEGLALSAGLVLVFVGLWALTYIVGAIVGTVMLHWPESPEVKRLRYQRLYVERLLRPSR